METSDLNNEVSPQKIFDNWLLDPTQFVCNSIKVPEDFDIMEQFWKIVSHFSVVQERTRHICLLSMNRVARNNWENLIEATAISNGMEYEGMSEKAGWINMECCLGHIIIQEHFYRHKWHGFEIVLANGGDKHKFERFIVPYGERSKFVLHLYH